MSRFDSVKGFTIVELLVTLALLGLIAALVVPGVNTWLSARQAATERDAVVNEIALLPLKARIQGEKQTITSSTRINASDNVTISEPIVVLANGFCAGGSFEISQGSIVRKFRVNPPYCEVSSVASN